MGNTQTTTPETSYPPVPTDQKSVYWWWTNSRNSNLFVSEIPPYHSNPNTEEKVQDVVVFWFHGLNSHSCHEENRNAYQFLSDRGFHVYSYDQAGWGRSSSDSDRGWIEDWNWWIDDGLSFIQHIMTLEKNSRSTFFISGISLGGAISLILGLKIQNLKNEGDPVWEKWAGVAVLCPAIEQSLEPAWIEIKALETAHALGGQKLPLGPLIDPDTFATPEIYQQFLNDPLCYTGRMKLGMAFQGREMLNYLITNLSEIKFPFMVCHGNKDDIVPLSGTEKLMSLSQTPEKHKTLHIIEGARHSLLEELIAQEAQVMAKVVEWMLVHKDRNQD